MRHLPLLAAAALAPLASLAPVAMGLDDQEPAKPQLIPFEELCDDIGNAGREETRALLTSAEDYAAMFAHEPPAEVDFSAEWVVFYSAGLKPTGGHEAGVSAIELTEAGRGLRITTRLLSPGKACEVMQHPSKPYVLAKLPIPARALQVVRFAHVDVQLDCTD